MTFWSRKTYLDSCDSSDYDYYETKEVVLSPNSTDFSFDINYQSSYDVGWNDEANIEHLELIADFAQVNLCFVPNSLGNLSSPCFLG